jgi:hypothetical protein
MNRESSWADAEAWGSLLAEGSKDWSYVPPVDDDPETWVAGTRMAWIEVMAAYTVELAASLDDTAYCVTHDEPDGTPPRMCADCWWADFGYDIALALARSNGRAWKRQVAA